MAKKQKAAAAPAAEGEAEGAAPKRKMSGKKLVLFIILPLILVIGGTCGVLFSGVLGGAAEAHAETEGHGEAPADGEHAAAGGEHGEAAAHGDDHAAAGVDAGGPSVFFDVPDMLVNLNTAGGRSAVMKVALSLELASEDDKKAVEAVMPRVMDQFQGFLRQLRRNDLEGSAGMYRLKEELRSRVALAAAPTPVRQVLIREMVVQ